ncbi:HPP family protein [Pseudomonas sp. NA-150]|uniref:HPP family protein n=1 Tax=Pseudomonas sp. NA-150 TaxID=3367525 RepID=UPI0037CC6B08
MQRYLTGWFDRFIPATLNTHPKEWFRASIGAGLGLLFSALACSQLFSSTVALHLLGPIAASAVIVFAVSSGALAQPWPIIGGYLTSVGVALVLTHYFGYTAEVGAAAVGLSLGAMCVLRCLHPPGAALALCLVLADGEITGMGWHVVYPVMLHVLCLVITALVYNNITGVRYPKLHVPVVAADLTPQPSRQEHVGISTTDLELALDEIGEFVDITLEELEDIFRTAEKYALRRSLGDIPLEQVMSLDEAPQGR